MRLFAPLGPAAFVLVAACTPGPSPNDGCEAGDAGPVDRAAYPSGPYGTGLCEVIAPLELVTDEGEPFSFDADIYADEGKSLLLLTTAAGWCGACIEEQGQLEVLHTDHAEAGLAIVVSYFEDSQFQPAGPDDAAAWREEHELTFDVVADTDNQLGAYYDTALTPMNMFVDIDTMEILRVQTGWDPSVVESVIESRL